MNLDALNPLDIAVVAVVFLSAVLAFARGFVREVLSVAAWVGAVLVALYAFPHLAPLARQQIETQFIADIATGAGVFVVALLVFSILSHRLSDKVREGRLSAIDRSLGFGFGALRGVLIACLAYMFMVFLWPTESDQPGWFKQARTLPMLARGSETLLSILPDPRGPDAAREAELQRIREERAAEDRRALERLSNPAPQRPNTAAPETERGYNTQDRGRMEQLIKNTDEPAAEPPPPQ